MTSLHYHFPWLVAANLRWSVFCAATKRKMPVNLDWAPFFEIADTDAPYEEKLADTRRSPGQRFQTDEFESFCATHLAHLDQVVWDFFGTESRTTPCARRSTALFPPHEVDCSPTSSGSASSTGAATACRAESES